MNVSVMMDIRNKITSVSVCHDGYQKQDNQCVGLYLSMSHSSFCLSVCPSVCLCHHVCAQKCLNTRGSYECLCHDGYQKQDNQCVGLYLSISVCITVVSLSDCLSLCLSVCVITCVHRSVSTLEAAMSVFVMMDIRNKTRRLSESTYIRQVHFYSFYIAL